MKPIITVFAVISIALTIGILYYNIKIVNKFRKDEELTATKLVIKKHVPEAFMSLSISSLFFSFGALLGAATIIFQTNTFQYFSEVGVVTMLTGLLTFMKRIHYAVRQKDEGQDSENESKESESSEEQDPDEGKEQEESEEQEENKE